MKQEPEDHPYDWFVRTLVAVTVAMAAGCTGDKGSVSDCMEQCELKGESVEACATWCEKAEDKGDGVDVVYDSFEAGEPGTFRIELEHDGAMRDTILYVPASYVADEAAALMINFHGFGGTSAGHMQAADMRSLAERDGFLLAYPQGTDLDGSPHWNAALDTPDNKSDADDLGYIRDLVARIGSNHPFDSERVYASGYSNGGMMAFALACYAGDLVAAVGAVSGRLLDNGSTCMPGHPTGVITLHGSDDSVLPYEGDREGLSAQDAVDFWVTYNATVASPEVASVESGGITIERSVYGQGRNGVSVEHYRYVGGDHVWFTEGYEDSNASALVWDFLARHDIDGAR